ncbi:MAG: MotA/TolQ/ExbB proton channel family protein [Verrucomicrobiota bacterium]
MNTMVWKVLIVIGFLGGSLMDFAWAQNLETQIESTPVVEQQVVQGLPIIDKLKQGGLVVLVQLLLSVAGVTYIIGSLMTIRRSKVAPEGLTARALQMWREGQHRELSQLHEKEPSVLAHIISFIVNHRENSTSEVNVTCGDIASREINQLLARAYPIAVIANLLPLLGLLGTVAGMIECFDTVALAGDMGDPSLLAGGISQALVTTAVGLALAIPMLYAYHHFKSRCNDYSARLEESVTELISAWMLKTSEVATESMEAVASGEHDAD